MSDQLPDVYKSTLVPLWKLNPAMLYYSNSVIRFAFPYLTHYTIQTLCDKYFDTKCVYSNRNIINGFRIDGYQIQLSYNASNNSKPLVSGTEKLSKNADQIIEKPFDLSTKLRGYSKFARIDWTLNN